MNLHLGAERFIYVLWFATAFAMFRATYCAILMMPHVKEGSRTGWQTGFPIGLADDELTSDVGRRYRDLFHRWLIYVAALFAVDVLAMYVHHRIWPMP